MRDHLKARIRLYLEKIELHDSGIMQPTPEELKRWLERLRELSKRLRTNDGTGVYWPVVFAAAMCIVFGYIGYRESSNVYVYSAPDDVFQITKRYTGFRYQMNWIHRGQAHALTTVFCQGYEPPLSAGQTIIWLAYKDLGSCWYIESKELGYALSRGADGTPTLAPNCVAGPKIVECTPTLTEAKF